MYMKNHFWHKNQVRALLLLLFCFSMIYGCVEGDDEARPQRSNVMFVNTYNGSPSGIDVLVNGTKIRTGSLAVGDSSGYNQVYSGKVSLSAVQQGGNGNASLGEIEVDLMPDKYYTCFVLGASGGAEFFMVEDDISAPTGFTDAKLRFINISSTAGQVSLGIVDSAALFEDIAHKGVSEYELVDSGLHRLLITASGFGGVRDTIDFRAIPRRIYNFYLWDGAAAGTLNFSLYSR